MGDSSLETLWLLRCLVFPGMGLFDLHTFSAIGGLARSATRPERYRKERMQLVIYKRPFCIDFRNYNMFKAMRAMSGIRFSA